jgi:hydroxyacylglutathione hydrolase
VYGPRHRPNTLNIVGNDSFAARVGAAVKFGSPIVILTADSEQAERLRQQLSLIGYDDVRGYAAPDPPAGETPQRIEQLDARAAAARAADGAIFVDVRELSEWRAGHVPGALHVPYEQLRERAHELPLDRPIVTYCESGARSSLASGVLEAAGHTVANLRGGFVAWRNADLPVSDE